MGFFNFNSNDPKALDRNKNIVTIGCLVIFTVIIIFLVVSSTKKKDNIKINDNNYKKINISSSINIKPEDEWLNKSENELKNLIQENKNLKDRLEEMERKQSEASQIYEDSINKLTNQINNTKSEILNNQQNNVNNGGYQQNEYGEIIPNVISRDIVSININLENTDLESNNKDNYIPAGSYAVAKMLSGADVSTGVTNQNDPNNMMFEIISPVYLPKYKGNEQEIKKLEGCRVMGAAVGQLWTEKAYIRLLKMTCSFEKGKFVEFNVKGYVTSFAKEGVRGKVVSREGYFTSMAFLSGMVEGLGEAVKTAYSPTLEVSTGIATEKIKNSDIAKQSGAGGVNKSAEILSDYFIKKAEQYQSVIDVPSGIEVEIVFQEGIDLTNNINSKVKLNNVNKKLAREIDKDMNANDYQSNVIINNGDF